MKTFILSMTMFSLINITDIHRGIDNRSNEIIELSPNQNVQLIKKINYEEISWDHLLSEYEREFYMEEVARYVEDPKYMGRPLPDPAVNKDLNGKAVKIPGYPVAVDIEEGVLNKAKTFLFVPTAGACIHIPPPPPNQTIYVEMDKSIKIDPYQPIYLEGIMYVEEGDNGIGAYFYKIDGDRVYKYE